MYEAKVVVGMKGAILITSNFNIHFQYFSILNKLF